MGTPADVISEINNLPKPYTMEEQYLYALVCDLAGVAPKAGYLVSNITFKSPFWRMQQYWHAFCGATELRMGLPVAYDDLTSDLKDRLLGEGKIDSSMLQEGIINENNLSSSVSNKLLGDNRVTTAMLQDGSVDVNKLADAVVARLLASKKVTEGMLADAVAAKLLGTKKVTKDMLDDEVVEILNKVK